MTSEFMSPDRWEQIQELYHAALELEVSPPQQTVSRKPVWDRPDQPGHQQAGN
jgi:hypothetical protein